MKSTVVTLALLGAWPLAMARGALPLSSLPMMDGALSGVFHFNASSPALAWHLAGRTTGAGMLTLEVSVDGKGVGLHGRACIDPATGDGTWQVTEVHFDLASWSAALTGDIRVLAGASMTGTLTGTGQGTIKHQVVDGTATLTLADGGMTDDHKKISCQGIDARIVLAGFHPLRTKPGQAITVQSISAEGAELSNVKIPFALAPGEVQVGAADGTVFGGKFATEPLVFALAQPSIKFVVHAKDFELAQIRKAADPSGNVTRQAMGKLSGKFTAYYDQSGFRVGPGALVMRKGEVAQILFQPTHKLFSLYIPPMVFDETGLPKIEAGKVALVIKTFRVKLYPGGERSNRIALIQFDVDSSDPRHPAAVSFDINIYNGSIQDLIDHGADILRAFK
ncbi:MAG: YdbH domain-containing protein, partial [Opitutaceae bacterium]